MQRILPETDLEKKMMCLGAIFVEENQVLDGLFQIFGSELMDDKEMAAEVKEQLLQEVQEAFFRLDMNYAPETKLDCIGILEEFWGVSDKSTALKSLENILQQGHRTKFNVLRSCVSPEGEIEPIALEKFKTVFSFDLEDSQELSMTDDDYRKLAHWIQKTHKYLKDSGILAWDAARYVHLVRLSFIAGYLTDNEAWAAILKLAPVTEAQFHSWMEFAQSFLIGRTFWSGTDDPQIKAMCEKLLGHPASPWQFYDWN